jgi:hypothetical protein
MYDTLRSGEDYRHGVPPVQEPREGHCLTVPVELRE